MLAEERNRELTSIGPNTKMGRLLRRYWYPVAVATDVAQFPKQVRILGENLALYRDRSGRYGLLDESCPHRGASLAYGISDDRGLRCAYHGWLFDAKGQCLEQPAESPTSSFHERIRIAAYPVREMGGMLWAYLGP